MFGLCKYSPPSYGIGGAFLCPCDVMMPLSRHGTANLAKRKILRLLHPFGLTRALVGNRKIT